MFASSWQAQRVRPFFRESLGSIRASLQAYRPGSSTQATGEARRGGGEFSSEPFTDPDSPTTQNGLAVALAELGRLDEAVAGFRHAVRLKPDFAEAHGNLGFALRNLGRLDEALATLRLAIQLKPDAALAYNNLGITLVDLGRMDEAIASFRQSVRLQPEFADAHKNLGIASLLSGNLEQGWPEYEWRWKTKAFASRLGTFTQPRWDGTPLIGRPSALRGAGPWRHDSLCALCVPRQAKQGPSSSNASRVSFHSLAIRFLWEGS